jgi:hypothetical protein
MFISTNFRVPGQRLFGVIIRYKRVQELL